MLAVSARPAWQVLSQNHSRQTITSLTGVGLTTRTQIRWGFRDTLLVHAAAQAVVLRMGQKRLGLKLTQANGCSAACVGPDETQAMANPTADQSAGSSESSAISRLGRSGGYSDRIGFGG